MKKLLLFLLFATAAFGQTASGSAMGWYKGPVDSHGCPAPDPKQVWGCIYTTGEFKISSLGGPYIDPVNMLTSGFSLIVDPVVIGPAGSQPLFQNVGTAAAPELKLTFPPPLPGPQGLQGIQGIQGLKGDSGTNWTTCPAFKINAVNPDGTWNVSFGAGCK